MVALIACAAALPAALPAAAREVVRVQEIAEPREVVYKKVGDEPLKLFVFNPPDLKAGDRRAAVVCIHGGGWVGGDVRLFFPHARYFASRGAVAISVQYRLCKPGGPTIFDCLADCKSAMRYIRANAGKLSVDPARIAAMGDSAGGHLAACLGVLDGLDDPADDLAVSAVPNALLLYNPILDLATTVNKWALSIPGIAEPNAAKLSEEQIERVASHGKTPLERANAISPMSAVAKGQPPVLLMHGTEDACVGVEQARQFSNAAVKAGNRCDYIELKGIAHAFVLVNYTAPEEVTAESIRAADRFLASLGYIAGKPTLRAASE